MSLTLRKGQRLRPIHPTLAKREWGVEGDGTVKCSYRVDADTSGAADRVDVEFATGRVVWGAQAAEFAIIEAKTELH
jgi:hypothetical protein